MTIYFVDTSFWAALIDRRDALHAQATHRSQTISGRIVTTEAVLLETANMFSKPEWRENAIALINHIKNRDDVEVVPFSASIWDRGWMLFGNRSDKSWSLTDCISFEVMRGRGLSEALTADSHFEQAGFQALLLPH
jgi:uncharacterized protein